MHNSSIDIKIANVIIRVYVAKCQISPRIAQAMQSRNFSHKKSMQPQKFSTPNNLHYTVVIYYFLRE